MESFEQARDIIYNELTSDASEVRAEFQKLFDGEAKVFAEAMARAIVEWRALDNEIGKDERKGYVSALVYAAITLHVQSLKLFLSGHMVAAGNLFRQVIESVSLALLSSGKELDVLDRFIDDKYSSNDAVRDVLRHWNKLGLKEDSLQALKATQDFYHRYSHITRLTLANLISFSGPGIYAGACFDNGKIDFYRKEVNGRVGLAKVFVNFIQGVKANVAKW